MQDSPTGLAAWIVDKFRAWSDCGGDVESRFTKDELLTNVMIYWVTETIESSFLPYYDFMNSGAKTWIVEAFKNWVGSSKRTGGLRAVPQGHLGSASRVGGALLQRAALDRDAERWPFRGHGRARPAGRGHPRLLPFSAIDVRRLRCGGRPPFV